MDWIQVVAGAGSIMAFIAAFNWWFLARIEKDIGKIEVKFEAFERRMDNFDRRMDAFDKRMDGHAARIDQLYGMFVQLLKEGRK